jgi:hypothetical protein
VVGPLFAELEFDAPKRLEPLFLLFFLALLEPFNPRELATADPEFAIELETELVALLIALIELLIAEVTELVAVDAGGNSIAGISGIWPLNRKDPPTTKI